MIHLLIFVSVQAIIWSFGVDGWSQFLKYLTDISWIGTESYLDTPYPTEMLYNISMIWGIAFIVDFLYSWSYTIFPTKQRGEKND